MKKIKPCTFCDDLGEEADGVWEITIFKKFRGSYGKKAKYICHNCLAESLEGYHTGGGLTGDVIKKIKRV